MLEQGKKWYLSKSVWGSLMVVAGGIAQYAGYDLGGPEVNAEAIVQLIGGGLAFYGRVKAVEKIK